MVTANVKKLIFPPYVDLESQNLTEKDLTEAIDIWDTNLSLLLRLHDATFYKQMLQNESLHEFLGTFLGIRARSHSVKHIDKAEIELEKKVLAVLLRTLESSKISSDQSENLTTLLNDLYTKNIISVPFLLDLATTYGKSNFTYTKKIFDNIIDSVPSLMKDFEFHSTTIINYMKAIGDKFKEIGEEDYDGEDDSYNSKMQDVKVYLSYILDIFITLDCLFPVFKPVVNIFNDKDDESFLSKIETFYDKIIPLISKLISENELNDLNILKHVLVSLAYHTLDACYFSPLGFTSIEVDDFSFIKSDENLNDDDRIKEMLTKMNDMIMNMIEIVPLEKPVQCFVDAPLILDIEIEFDLIGKLIKIKNEISDGDDVLVDYTIKSLESLRLMNQESEKPPWSMRLKQKQKRYISRMSNGSTVEAPTIEVKSNGINDNDNEIYLMSLISQVQEVFPDLGEGFIEACLSTYDNNVETVIDRLLTQSLPEHLASLDHTSPRQVVEEVVENQNGDDLLSQRKNIFDNDEFDVFSGKTLDTSRIHRGKMNRGTADKLLDDKSFIKNNKDSMLNMAYKTIYEDEYEDEYDDTYDTSGLNMGGIDLHTIDEIDELGTSSRDKKKTEIDPGIMHEEKLIKMYQSDPSVFDRTNTVRKSDKRAQLRKITKMTDEQIEGWYIMFERNPRKDKLLMKYEWDGNQEELVSNASDDGNSSRISSRQGNYNQFRGRPRGRGGNRGRGRGRGRSESGSQFSRNSNSGDASTYSRNKYKNNYNQKNAYTKKMARGFGRPPE